MESDTSEPQLFPKSNLEPDASPTDSEILECGIGGCRFGVFVSDVIETDVWAPDYLTRLPSCCEAVLGTVFFDGNAIPVVDLRKLFREDDAFTQADTLMSMIVSHQGRLCVLLLEGLLGTESISKAAFQSFASLYVCGVKWINGAFVFEDRAVPMLDLKALFESISSTTSAFD